MGRLPAVQHVQQTIGLRDRAASAKASDLQDAALAATPTNVRSMLATLVHLPFDRRGWLFEIKWDGYRAIAEVDKGQVRLFSRNGLCFTKRYWPITAALQKLEFQAVLDGEVVVLDEKGHHSFEGLQSYRNHRATGPLVYQVFDILDSGWPLSAWTIARLRSTSDSGILMS
jgi:bifunctional non-homologous end joining protein LigD